MQRGQTAIEFIFLILIILVYIFTMTRPMIDSAKSSFEDIETVIKTNNEAEKIFNSINRISNFSDNSKEKLFITLPKNGLIKCHSDGNIELIAKINIDSINPEVTSCKDNICDKNYATKNNINCNIVNIEGSKIIIIGKSNNEIYINQG